MRDSRAYGKRNIGILPVRHACFQPARLRSIRNLGSEELAATRSTVQPRDSGERFRRTANENQQEIVLTTAMETAMALLSSCVAWPVVHPAMQPDQATVRLSALRSSSECHSLTENSSKPDAPLV
jgi:hypothetical protein